MQVKQQLAMSLGWVSVEEFIRNDHAWPIDDPRAVKRYCSKEEGS